MALHKGLGNEGRWRQGRGSEESAWGTPSTWRPTAQQAPRMEGRKPAAPVFTVVRKVLSFGFGVFVVLCFFGLFVF